MGWTPPQLNGIAMCQTERSVFFSDRKRRSPLMKLSRVGVDLAKNVYQLHGIDRHGKTVRRRSFQIHAMDEIRNLIKGIFSNDAVTLLRRALQRVSGTLIDFHANVWVV